MTKALLFLISVAVLSCSDMKRRDKTATYKITEIVENNSTPTVDMAKCNLIGTESENRMIDAKQILLLKRNWPLIMQSPNRTGFDTILAQNFTFSGDGQLLNREAYIADRIKPSEWKITHVKYDNLTLQFFDNTALLTYKNQVTNENTGTEEVEIEYISWADMYVLEDGKWKIGAAHVIDIRVEKMK